MGDMFGPYRLEALIGRGSVGEVHRAFDTRRDRMVALMLLSGRPSADAAHRFRREAAVVAKFSDPHVIPIHDFGEIDGRLFIDTRLVDAVNLAETLARDGPLAPARAVDIVGQIASTLNAARASGLIHGDVKPSNVLVAGTARDFVYLLDFGGLARHAVDEATATARGGAGWVGSLYYLAPERILDRPLDQRIDVYDLACLLYEMLTGTKPFSGRSVPDLMHAHLSLPPPRPSETSRELAPFDDIIARGMAKDPQRRYQSAGELADAARAAVKGHVPAPTEGWGVFISYRRSDTRHVAARVGEKLGIRLGESRVFLDVSSIRPGVNFHDAVRSAIQRSSVMLVLIGNGWTDAAHPDGRRRLDDPEDNVRIEIEEGLRHRLVIIPVLIDGTTMPPAVVLPETVTELARRNAVRVDHASFRRDDTALVDLVVEQLEPTDTTTPRARSAVEELREPGRAIRDRLPGKPRTVMNDQLTAVRGHGMATLPGITPPQLPLRRRWSRAVSAAAAALIVVGAAVAGVIALNGSQSGGTGAGTNRASETLEPTIEQPVSPATDPVALVQSYYALLPVNTDGAFALLSPAAQEAAGGREGFDGFYARMESVTIEDVRLVGENTVEATVVFVERDGPTSRDPYRFVVATSEDGRRIIQSFSRL